MTCPLPLDALPKPLHKHVDPKAPPALRMMGAKGLVPAVAAPDLAVMLFFLSFDEDPGVREAAARTAAGLPDRIFGVALRAEGLPGPVLDWLSRELGANEGALELVLLNPATSDETVARLAAEVSQRLTEIVRQNELRLLRHDEIIRQLCRNPNALASTVDGACDFCVRNGLTLLDVPQLVAAHRRVHGVDPAAAEPQDTATGLLGEYGHVLAEEEPAAPAGPPRPEDPAKAAEKLNITQRILKMSVSQKIKLATLGNKEARTILLRDSNKLVCMAAATSPRITDLEILGLANSRTVNADVLRYVYTNREFLRTYPIKLALVKNPKVPLPTALKMLFSLQEKDIKELSRDRNVPQTIQSQAKAFLMKKEQAARATEGKH
ncbi:hypothetical protein [Anaeromyxobacter paludicola]|uniref:DUF2336 domain-containing protein n=1 Tax=Anaeromyxobacter paludicola TaxID=2918171 RepID=A0ABN6N242_9BACT|nr:hypothetical protein [Anaeromyxobacter paludicola]BDG07238.1 hypothetical protein AMPC_03510 [Anaeromyxobacter paludicola]